LSESRVCQLHSQAVARLRSRIFEGENPVVRTRGRPKGSKKAKPASVAV